MTLDTFILATVKIVGSLLFVSLLLWAIVLLLCHLWGVLCEKAIGVPTITRTYCVAMAILYRKRHGARNERIKDTRARIRRALSKDTSR